MTDEELRLLHREAEATLKNYPGVVGVGLGLKERGDKLTDEVSFRVYVVEKKDPSQLNPEEMIPAQYKGISTDVIKIQDTIPQAAISKCEDHIAHSPLIGGITVVTNLQGPRGYAPGTLGFFVTIDSEKEPNNIGFITNNHVITSTDGGLRETVNQPEMVPTTTGAWGMPPPEGRHPIGTVIKLPDRWLTARAAPVSGPPRHLRSCPHPPHGLYPAYTPRTSVVTSL